MPGPTHQSPRAVPAAPRRGQGARAASGLSGGRPAAAGPEIAGIGPRLLAALVAGSALLAGCGAPQPDEEAIAGSLAVVARALAADAATDEVLYSARGPYAERLRPLLAEALAAAGLRPLDERLVRVDRDAALRGQGLDPRASHKVQRAARQALAGRPSADLLVNCPGPRDPNLVPADPGACQLIVTGAHATAVVHHERLPLAVRGGQAAWRWWLTGGVLLLAAGGAWACLRRRRRA